MRENLGPRQMQREHVDDNVTLNRRKARGRGTQVCRYKIPLLKKAITRMRREKKVKRSANHPPVGSMKAPDVIDYLYDTASALHWNWSTVISGPEKKRVSKKCQEAPGTGRSKAAPTQIVPKRVTKLSSWQEIVKQVFQDRQFNEGTNYSFQEKMNEAKRRYRAQKAGQAQSAARAASARATAALPKFQKKSLGREASTPRSVRRWRRWACPRSSRAVAKRYVRTKSAPISTSTRCPMVPICAASSTGVVKKRTSS